MIQGMLIWHIMLFIGAAIGLYSLLQGAPALPTKRKAVEALVALAAPQSGMRAVDLGSGDGRIVIALARSGIEAHGYEFNPLLVWWSRWLIRRQGLSERAFIHQKNFWHENFAPYDIVAVFGAGHIMAELEKKLRQELKPGAKVVSNVFQFPLWAHARRENGVFLYINS